MSDSAAWGIGLGVLGWCLVAGVVVWWIDRKMKQAPPDPNDVETALRQEAEQDEEKAP